MPTISGRTIEELANMEEMTKRIQKLVDSEELWERAWKYCKNIAKFSHAPVALSEYRRMQKYVEDEELVDVVFRALQGYLPDNSLSLKFDTIGFYYGIALISQSNYKRERTLAYLNELADYMIANEIDSGSVLYRNMNKLKKDFPDLSDLEKKLKSFSK